MLSLFTSCDIKGGIKQSLLKYEKKIQMGITCCRL